LHVHNVIVDITLLEWSIDHIAPKSMHN